MKITSMKNLRNLYFKVNAQKIFLTTLQIKKLILISFRNYTNYKNKKNFRIWLIKLPIIILNFKKIKIVSNYFKLIMNILQINKFKKTQLLQANKKILSNS